MLLSGCGDNIEISTIGQSIQKIVDKNTQTSYSANSTFKIREDSANNAVLQDDVVTITASDTENSIKVNQYEHSITISNKSKELDNLKEDGVIYILPCESLPEGLVAKAVKIENGNDNVTITCEEPTISEVFESIDISRAINVPVATQTDNSNHAQNSSNSQSPYLIQTIPLSTKDSKDSDKKDEDSGLNFEELYQYYENEKQYSDDGKIWGAYAGYGERTSFTIETDNFSKKDGVYAQSTFTLTLMVDFQMTTQNKEILTFDLNMEIDSDIESTLGYHKSVDTKEQRVELANVAVPLCGPMVMDIKPYLVARASGEISIEATTQIFNATGFRLSNENGLEPLNNPEASVTFNASAEGSVEGGMGVYMDIALVGLNFFDDMDIAYADATVGIVVDGSTNIAQSISFDSNYVSYSGNQNTPDEDGRLHSCYVCVEGECNSYLDLKLGLNEKLEKMLQKINDKIKLSYTFEREKEKLFDWHCSTGDGYTMEFEYNKCPHMEYEVDVKVVEKGTFAPISGAVISIGNLDIQSTDSEGNTIWYLPNGDYTVNANSKECDPDTVTDTFKIKDEREYITLEMEKAADLYYPYIRDVLIPELGLFDVGTVSYDYTRPSEYPYGWDERTGIVSAYVTDLDADNVDDMLMLAVEKGTNENGYSVQVLYIYVYTIEDKEVVCKDKEMLDNTWINLGKASCTLMVYAGEEENKTIWYEGYHNYAEYWTPYYVSFKYKDGQLTNKLSFYQTEGGDVDRGYGVIDGQTGDKTVIWVEESDGDHPREAGIYNDYSMEEAFEMAFKKFFGMPHTDEIIEGTSSYPSWKSQSYVMASIINEYSYEQSGRNFTEHYAMTYKDSTALRERLQQLEDN
jgi:hypothetical protein